MTDGRIMDDEQQCEVYKCLKEVASKFETVERLVRGFFTSLKKIEEIIESSCNVRKLAELRRQHEILKSALKSSLLPVYKNFTDYAGSQNSVRLIDSVLNANRREDVDSKRLQEFLCTYKKLVDRCFECAKNLLRDYKECFESLSKVSDTLPWYGKWLIGGIGGAALVAAAPIVAPGLAALGVVVSIGSGAGALASYMKGESDFDFEIRQLLNDVINEEAKLRDMHNLAGDEARRFDDIFGPDYVVLSLEQLQDGMKNIKEKVEEFKEGMSKLMTILYKRT